MSVNWKQIYMRKKIAEKKILKVAPALLNQSGVYIFWRLNEEGRKVVYIGQAKHLVNRLVQHLTSYSQHIDISLKKRGLAPDGEWELLYFYCDIDKLDDLEKYYINSYTVLNSIILNITSGGQGEGKEDINMRKQPKGYHDGLVQGYLNCRKYVAEMFDKYLAFGLDGRLRKKDGQYSKLALKKYKEFEDFLKGKDTE